MSRWRRCVCGHRVAQHRWENWSRVECEECSCTNYRQEGRTMKTRNGMTETISNALRNRIWKDLVKYAREDTLEARTDQFAVQVTCWGGTEHSVQVRDTDKQKLRLRDLAAVFDSPAEYREWKKLGGIEELFNGTLNYID